MAKEKKKKEREARDNANFLEYVEKQLEVEDAEKDHG